jgi:hypothetical protein
MVGVQLDETRHQQVAAKIFPALRRMALPNLNDVTADDRDPACFNHRIGEHNPGV